MNNIQKAFKNKAKRGLRMAIGGLLAPGRGNDLTRSRQMGEAASEMERTRLASEADFRKRMSTPPVTAARGPLDNQVAMGEAMAGLSNTERYKLGGSGTAAEASEIDQRNDIMKRLNAAMPEVPQLQVNRQPRPGLLGGQDELLGMNLARGTGSLNCASGVVFRDGNSFGDRPMMPAAGARPQRPVPTRVAPPTAAPQRVAIPLPAPEYPQERARPVAVAATPPGTYPGVAGVPGLLRARSAANIDARDYADGGLLDKIIRTVGRVLPDSNGQKYEPGIQSRAAEDPARHGRAEALNPRTQSSPSETPPAGGFQEEAERRRKQMEEAKNYEAGGLITPVNLGQGLYQAIAQPIAEDWRQGNAAIKKVRDQYPTADTLAGINPFVAAAQVANDVAAGNVGGDTAINVAQAVPVIKGLSGMAKMLTKQAGPTIGATKFVIDMPNTVRKNVALTTGQTLGQPANAFAAGGIVRGKGGPTDDEVSMSIGGTDVNLSPREAVLPVKTVMALGGPAAVEDLIERTNGKPPVRSGLRAGGNYAAGAGGIEIPDDYMRGRQPPPVQPTVPPLTPEQEMLKRAAASRAADAQARAAQEASQAARSAEAGMRTPGGAAQAAPSRMSNLRAALNPADATKIEDIPRMIKEGGAKLAGSKAGSVVAEVGKRAPSAGPALAGLEGAVRGINTTDAEYAQRLGVDEPTTRLGSIAVRAPGVLSDVGASVINAAALPYNAVRHGLNFNNYYDYRDNFDDVASAKAQAAAAPVVAAKSAAPVGQPQAPASAQTGTQVAPEPAMAAAADIQARSMAAEGLRSGAQREMNLPPTQQQDVVNGGSLVQRGNVGLRSIATNPAVQDALNVANEQQGTGVAYSTVKGADGKPQVMISGGQPTKPQYIAADGTPTNDWKQTAQYAESKGLHARNKQALRDIEMENARGDMASALPFYQGRGLRTMATRLREDELAQKGQITPAQAAQLAMQREGLDATIENRKEDNARAAAAAKAAESENHRKATDDLIKSWATTDGKPDEQKYAFLQKYASQFERPQGMSSAEHLGNLMDNFAIDTMGDTEGRHWLSAEGTWNGERTKWQKRAAKDSLRRGAPLQSVEYHDPLTGRTIYQSDVNKLSPNQRKLFESRVYQ